MVKERDLSFTYIRNCFKSEKKKIKKKLQKNDVKEIHALAFNYTYRYMYN